jgi:CRISPR-associated protein Csx17
MIHIHHLDGCAPTPLAHYLKAIGILRLVAEQADSGARGWWDGPAFKLATKLSVAELESFFADEYEPSPLFAPWNGASGFFRTWDSKNRKLRNSKNVDALEALLSQGSDRWLRFKRVHAFAISAIKRVAREIDISTLSESARKASLIFPLGQGTTFLVADKNTDKAEIQLDMIEHAGRHPFYRSVIVNMGNGDWGYPSLWGSGGNDGAMDFTARYFQCLQLALITQIKTSQSWLHNSLFRAPTPGCLTGARGKVGMYLPSGAGGANSIVGVGSQDNTLLNPWDLILFVEGASLFASSVTKRLENSGPAAMSAPFASQSRGAGYSSASSSDESPDGEQWMPLWERPLCLDELNRLLAEGRAQLGARAAREPLDLARAIARLGTARGIAAFQRYGYIERNGQSNLAVPLGRFSVPSHAAAKLACLDDLDIWLDRLRRESRAQHAEARLKIAERQLGDGLLALTQHPDDPRRWQRVLFALAALESVMASGTGFKAGPIPPLRPEWVTAADDGSPAFRLALVLALQRGTFEGTDARWWNSVRRHWLPLDRRNVDRFAQSGTVGSIQLLSGPEIVMAGRSGEADAIALVQRRLVEAAQHGQRRLPLLAGFGVSAHPADLAALVSGTIDLDQTLALARALMALDGRRWHQTPVYLRTPHSRDIPDDAWLVVRLALLPSARRGSEGVLPTRSDPAVFRRLATGDATGAVELALRRLRSSGIRTAVRAATLAPFVARRWAAALAFAIDERTATRFLVRLDPARREATTED